MGELHARLVAWGVTQIETEALTNCQVFSVIISKHTNAEFWSLKVSQNSNWPPCFLFNLTNNAVPLADFRMFAMAHVQSKYVCTRIKQRAYCLLVAGSRTKGGNDLYIALTSHARDSSCGQAAFVGLLP